jgi:hypothetical protein
MIKPAPRLITPCCGVFAAFLAHHEPEFVVVFDKAKGALNKAGNWQGRMAWSELLSLLRSIGIQYAHCFGIVPMSFGKAAREGLFEDGTQYVIWIRGHFMTWRNGLIYDQLYPEGVKWESRNASRCKIKGVVKIL